MTDRTYISNFGVKDYSSDKKTKITINPSQSAGTEVTATLPALSGTAELNANLPSALAYLSRGIYSNTLATNALSAVPIHHLILSLGNLRLFQFRCPSAGAAVDTNLPVSYDIASSLGDDIPSYTVARACYNLFTSTASTVAKLDTDGILSFTTVGNPGLTASYAVDRPSIYTIAGYLVWHV